MNGQNAEPFYFYFLFLCECQNAELNKSNSNNNKQVKAMQYELPEEATGLSVFLTVRYICEGQNQTKEN